MVITGHFVDGAWALREGLLYFKRLDGTASPSWMANALMQTLTGHGIQDRVFALTIDTASPNDEMLRMVESLQLQQAPLPSDIEIIRTPYLTSVVKLCLNRFLEHMGALPLDEIEQEFFGRRRLALDRAMKRGRAHEISHTLNKLRYLQFNMIEWEDYSETFKNLQDNGERLLLISDSKSRWNSTFLMLHRAEKLREFIAPFCAHHGYAKRLLDDEEWRQIDYLLCVMEPFVEVVNHLALGGQASMQSVLHYYQNLFEHLEDSIKQLRKKHVPWKRQILESLEICREELAKAHEETTQNSIYAVGTMLAPDFKYRFFRSDKWEKEKRGTYQVAFRKFLLRCQEKPLEPFDHCLLSMKTTHESYDWIDTDSELHDGWFFNESLEFWKAEHDTSPCVAKLARNLLPVPASGGAIERLFNTARQASCDLNLPESFMVLNPKLMLKPKPRRITEEFEGQFLSTFTTKFKFTSDQSQQYEILVAVPEEKEILFEETDVFGGGFPNVMDDVSISDTEETDDSADDRVDSGLKLELPDYTAQRRMSGRKRKAREEEDYQYQLTLSTAVVFTPKDLENSVE
ncbi:hypothetical protein N7540_010131 [Penicillium herquei]|nr:hypothetical protein N7540_010131 [Penicillium herquei]